MSRLCPGAQRGRGLLLAVLGAGAQWSPDGAEPTRVLSSAHAWEFAAFLPPAHPRGCSAPECNGTPLFPWQWLGAVAPRQRTVGTLQGASRTEPGMSPSEIKQHCFHIKPGSFKHSCNVWGPERPCGTQSCAGKDSSWSQVPGSVPRGCCTLPGTSQHRPVTSPARPPSGRGNIFVSVVLAVWRCKMLSS